MTIPSDSAIAQAFRELSEDVANNSGHRLEVELIEDVIHRAREIDASRGGADYIRDDQTHPATGRREGAVRLLLADGWTWDGKAWVKPPQPAAAGELPEALALPEPYAYETRERIDEDTADFKLWHWPMGQKLQFPEDGYPLFTSDQLHVYACAYASAAVAECRRDAERVARLVAAARRAEALLCDMADAGFGSHSQAEELRSALSAMQEAGR